MNKAEEFLDKNFIGPGYILSYYNNGANAHSLTDLLDEYAQQVSRKIAERAFNEAGKLTPLGLKWEDFNDYWESVVNQSNQEKYPDTDVRGDATENLPSNQEESK